jgi:alpha/beta hydrolase fold
MAGSSATWRSVLPQLSKKFRVIAPDLLGHGESAKPRSDYSLGAFAVLLRDFLDELGVSQATVVELGPPTSSTYYCKSLLTARWSSSRSRSRPPHGPAKTSPTRDTRSASSSRLRSPDWNR